MMVAIIQVAGPEIWRNARWSYAYQLSRENSIERGPTEFLYERWSESWKRFRQDAGDYARRYPEGIVFQTDVKSYYTRIVHDRLDELVRMELSGGSKRIEWLVRAVVRKRLPGHEVGRGLVQGSIGSGFLANVYLSGLDRLFPVNDLHQRRLHRYVDDIYVIIPDPALKDETIQLVEQAINGLA